MNEISSIAASTCDGARRAQRRKDTARAVLPSAEPSAETLTALAQAMGAAGFEHREGRTLVKRLIAADSQPDLDVVEHQGVIGKAGVDFPAYPTIPNTGFNCKNVPTGYYADLETDCQVFHICDTSRKISFLCPNGTIFSQSHLICDWWFKVDCASAPALYESSAEYYSNEQKKSQKITQSLSKNVDYQQIVDTSARAESRRSSVNVPSTTERLLRHRQRLQTEAPKATARSFHAIFAEANPTLKTEATTTFEKRRRNLVQLIANNFGNAPARTTLPTYTEASTYRTDKAAGDYNGLKEMQVAAETASFTNNKNRQYLQDTYNKNYRPYPVYTPNIPPKVSKPKSNPTLTTLYDFRDKTLNQVAQEVTITTKRPTLLPYTKSYANIYNDRREPYTRPGISSLKDFLDKERNKTLTPSTTEKIAQVTDRSDQFTSNVQNKVIIETKNNFESVTKIPQTTRNQYFGETSSDRFDTFSTTNFNQITTEPSYQERRERLMRKLNLDTFHSTEPTVPTTITEKYYGDLPNRPGLVVPPSLTPKTLHTLAIYYATALDNLSTTAPPEETSDASTPLFDDYGAMEDALPALFSQHTINKYSKLFGHGTETSELLEEIKLDPNGTYNELADDLAVQQSQNPLATSPQIRELAQVFTHALSAYLQDPVQFRKVLSDIRPTHPSFGDMLSTTEESYNTEPTTTVNEDDDEILGFSDDNKIRSPFVSLRDGKSLNIATEYPTVSDEAVTTPATTATELISTTAQPTTPRNPFRCCGRISASYTTASTPFARNTTPFAFTNTVAANVNTLANNYSDVSITTTEDSYSVQRFGGFQNNSNNSPYGKEVIPTNAKPLTEYVEVTNLPSAWGVDADATLPPITNADNIFESKKIRTTTGTPETTPVYFTEGDSSIELENEEELQRAHSQSFVTPQNNLRQGKQINFEEAKTTVKKPSEDLEAPTISEISTTTIQSTTQPSTTIKEEESASTVSPVFTSPDSDKTSDFNWPTTFEYWQSTVIDPITLNDGLSPSGPEQAVSQLASQTNTWAQNILTTPATETKTNEQAYSSSVLVESTTPRNTKDEKSGKLVYDPTSTESAKDLTTIADTVVEKAKEIMGGMNATTTEKLMNVMKKTKSKTVRRLILLLVQTCDDDHNTTAEASKKALLEALMAVSQKDMDEIAKEEGVSELPTTAGDIEVKNFKRSDKIAALEEIRPKQFERRGKSINFDPTAINSLSSPSSTITENVKTTTEIYTETTQAPRTTAASRRGVKKFLVRTTPVEQKTTKSPIVDSPIAEARVAPNDEAKTPADTRALELLRSLYTIAARWAASTCDGARRAQRRKDTARAVLPSAEPSAETLTALAQAMGAAGFEHREGRTLVKRLIAADSQPDLDVVEHQGVIGKAGVDFPAYPTIPNTGFNCKNVPTGYYADLETDCQVFHICDTSRKISFLCPNGTIFSQSHLICDWWFKVDCASAPALYESSAEYYSNEQKKSQKITQSLSKNVDYQQIVDTSARAESRRSSVNVPSTTERLLRHRQRLQTEAPKATARSFHAIFAEANPTLKTEATTTFEKRRRNLVQLIANNFGNAPARTTLPTYTEASTYRTDKAAGDYNGLKEMQVAAETASFTNNKNRQYLQDTYNKNYRPYPVYTPNIPPKVSKPKSNPTLTTLYDFRDKTLNQVAQEVTITTKRPTLLPYTKSYANIYNDRREPYTRPGISSLKDFLDKERNKTLTPSTTEKIAQVTDRSDQFTSNVQNKVIIETKNNFESVTKIPQTTRNQYFGETSSDRFDTFSTTNFNQITTEPSYQERRERLMRKLNLDTFHSTEPTVPTTITEKYYGDLPNRPGLVVPPSLTPKTLHTLAIYYATALDNLSTTAPPEETSDASTPLFDDYGAMEDALPALFSQHTINKYSKLFGHGTETSELLEEIKLDPNGTYNELADDLAVQQSQNPLATSPQIRELAQVFTHALSAYLQDPVQFRKVLSDIRPTHPSFGDMLSTTEESYNTEPTTTVNEDDDEILGFSDDNKIRSPFVSLRDGKSLNIATEYPTVSDEAVTTPATTATELISTTAQPTTPRNPFRCCGRISASYTTASTPFARNTTPFAFTNTVAANVNTLANNYSDVSITTTEDSYSVQRFGGFQNNSNNSPYGKEVIPTNAKPLTEYVEVTNLPSAWGVDADATLPPITNADNIFESKKIRTTTGTPETTPVYFTEGDSSIELENEEELQRAHSQSFVTPQNNLRQGKQINFEEAKTTVKKPSEDLEAPTISEISTTTIQSTTQPSTTIKEEESASTVSPVFTSPDSDKTSDFNWPTTFEYWQSTVIDPITLNDGLSPSGPEQAVSQLASQTNTWAQNILTTPATETKTNEQAYSSSVLVESTTPRNTKDEKSGKLVYDPTSTESAKDLTTIADTVVEKAKEIMGGMNATTTEKLMNVMKKTKSKTVRRLILLLVQTCDDDHNTTAEASKKALLEALMAVSQKDMDEIAKEEGVSELPTTAGDIEVKNFKRSDKIAALEEIRPKQFERRGKSINFDPTAINSLSSPSSTITENVKTTTEIYTETTQAPRTTAASRRGVKKFLVRTTPVEQKTTKSPIVDSPIAEARVAPNDEAKTPADTRALELLRSLYTIAARWG